jgi:hypothetical protein
MTLKDPTNPRLPGGSGTPDTRTRKRVPVPGTPYSRDIDPVPGTPYYKNVVPPKSPKKRTLPGPSRLSAEENTRKAQGLALQNARRKYGKNGGPV